MKKLTLLFVALLLIGVLKINASEKDTFTPYTEPNTSLTFNEMWAGYDPKAEPLEIEVLKQWEEEGVVLQVVRYRAFRFKGENAMIAAIYGYPKGAKNIPGLVQMHGGGMFADYRAVLANARHGYATISVAWAGRVNSPDYRVDSDARVAYINGEKDALVTTNYGVLDGFHAPSTHKGTQTTTVKPTEWTIDSVESPRNACYFLWTVAGRRAITFLQAQDVVDADRIGVYGHSMGGRLTALVAGSDDRIKAAVPTCGGFNEFELSEKEKTNPSAVLLDNTISNRAFTSNISCPILYLNPINDFNGVTDNSQQTFSLMQTTDYGIVSSPHRSHGDNGDNAVGGILWFNDKLKGEFDFPSSPKTTLKLGEVPTLSVEVDQAKKVVEVEVYYTQDGVVPEGGNDRNNRKSRFWHYAKPEKKSGKWVAKLPLETTERELWVYAHVKYALDEPVRAAGYGYQDFTTDVFHLSSVMQKATVKQLSQANAKVLIKPSLVIEDFSEGWQKEYYVSQENRWTFSGHKLYSSLYQAPSEDAKLEFKLRSKEKNKMIINLDDYHTIVNVAGGGELQTITLTREDFKNRQKQSLPSWKNILMFTFAGQENLSPSEKADANNAFDRWRGEFPGFVSISWVE